MKPLKKRAPKRSKSPGPGRAAAPLTAKRVSRVIKQIRDLIEPICESDGFDLIHIEFQPEAGGRIMRLYIDKPDGVTLDDCVYVSRQINDLLDVSLDDIGPYNLEVSSPGPERPLGRESDFERFKGHIAKLKTRQPIEGQKQFTGRLAGMVDEQVQLTVNGKTIALPYEDIARARLVEHGENRR